MILLPKQRKSNHFFFLAYIDIIGEKARKRIVLADDSVTLINKCWANELSQVLVIRYAHPLRKKALCGFVLYSICDKQARSYTALFVNTRVLMSVASVKAQVISYMNYTANDTSLR